MPDFVVIGARKCGTTSLFSYLNRDERIFIPQKKELDYFSDDDNLHERLADYQALFAPARADQLCGDVSPSYAQWHHMGEAPRRIHEAVPDAPLIYLLRDPIDRAYSGYRFRHLWGYYRGNTPPTFEDAIERDPDIVHTGAYMETLDRYLEFFPPSQILCELTEDLAADANGVLARVQRHLGLEPVPLSPEDLTVYLDAEQKRRSAMIDRFRANPALNWALDRIPRPARTAAYKLIDRSPLGEALAPGMALPPMRDDTRQMLRDRYAESNRRLADYLGRDLSHWCA